MKEPAVLLISPTGNVRFWPSNFLGLAGAERFYSTTLALASSQKGGGERVTRVQLNTSFMAPEAIAGTSRGRLFRITVGRSAEDAQWSVNFREIGVRPAR